MTQSWWDSVGRSSEVTAVPVFQFAIAGRWEEAVAVPINIEPAQVETLVDEISSQAAGDIAVEVYWAGQFFVGARWDRREGASVVAGVKRVQAALETPGPSVVGTALVALVGRAPSSLPEFAEVGAVNAWRTSEPIVLWKSGETLDGLAIDEALSSRPDLAECEREVAVEIAVTRPSPSWVGCVVSTPAGTIHRVDRRALDNVLRLAVRPSRGA